MSETSKSVIEVPTSFSNIVFEFYFKTMISFEQSKLKVYVIFGEMASFSKPKSNAYIKNSKLSNEFVGTLRELSLTRSDYI